MKTEEEEAEEEEVSEQPKDHSVPSKQVKEEEAATMGENSTTHDHESKPNLKQREKRELEEGFRSIGKSGRRSPKIHGSYNKSREG